MNDDTKDNNGCYIEVPKVKERYPSPELAEARIKLALRRHKTFVDKAKQSEIREKVRL